MKMFFDEEFTDLHRNTTLISIGLVAENGESFYAEFNDYDKTQVENNEWIKKNVIDNLAQSSLHRQSMATMTLKGTKKEIKLALLFWLDQFDTVEWFSDVCHYDFVLLIDLLWGNARNMPKKFAPVCHDINYDIAAEFSITETQAFNKSREEILEYYQVTVDGDKHNSIYDARVIALIYRMIKLGKERP